MGPESLGPESLGPESLGIVWLTEKIRMAACYKTVANHYLVILYSSLERVVMPNMKRFFLLATFSTSLLWPLAAMAACDHHIISNSTFSWWGAWLNPSPAKQVVRPSVWWGARTAHLEDADICPESWQIADV